MTDLEFMIKHVKALSEQYTNLMDQYKVLIKEVEILKNNRQATPPKIIPMKIEKRM